MTCTFFGHRDCPSTISQKLKTTLEDLICTHSVDRFYVGNHGNFDFYTRKILQKLKEEYPQITYYVVLAYLPQGHNNDPLFGDENTILADGVENVPRKFAIL